MKALHLHIADFVANEDGATVIEYAIIASLLSIAIVGSVVAINGTMVETYDTIRSYIVPALEGEPGPNEE